VKKIENRLVFDKVIKCTKMVPFFGPPCILLNANVRNDDVIAKTN